MSGESNREVVRRALSAWASAIRLDWGSIDGRGCRDELNALGALLMDDAPETRFEDACRLAGVCPVEHTWPEHCPEAKFYDCPHMAADWYEAAGSSGEGSPQ